MLIRCSWIIRRLKCSAANLLAFDTRYLITIRACTYIQAPIGHSIMYSSKNGASVAYGATASTSFVGKIKEIMRPLYGAAITISSTYVAQVIGGISSCDFVMIDMEHAPLSAETATNLVHAVAAAASRAGTSCHTLVRIPSSGVEWVKWALDSGASGIIIPMVNNEVEMKQIIDRALYPPAGSRSFGPMMASLTSSKGDLPYFERARRGDIAIIPMIESREGLANVDKIMAVSGVSGVFIGPFDLRLALGLPGGIDGREPIFEEAIENICDTARRHGKVVGSLGMGAQLSRKRAEQGMHYLVAAADNVIISRGVEAALAEALEGLDTEKKPTPKHSSL